MDKDNHPTHPQPAPPTYPYYLPQVVPEDEISLIDLFQVLAKRKMTILTTLVAFSYALIALPPYKAEAILLPPLAKDIQLLNIQGVQGPGVASVYSAFKRNLNSRAWQRRFVEEQGIIEILAPEEGPKISILRKRNSDDAFIPGLRDLQEKIARLRSIRVDEVDVHAVAIDQATFFMNFLDNQRKEEEATA